MKSIVLLAIVLAVAAAAPSLQRSRSDPPKYINRPRPPSGKGSRFGRSLETDAQGSIADESNAERELVGIADVESNHDLPEARKVHGSISVGVGGKKHKGKKIKGHININGKIQWDEPEPEPRDVHGSVQVGAGVSSGHGGHPEGHVSVGGKIDWDEDAQQFVVTEIEGIPEPRDVHGSVGAEAGVSTGKGGHPEGHVSVGGKIDWDEDAQQFVVTEIEGMPEPRDVHGSVGAEAGVSTGKGGHPEGHVSVGGKIDWDEAEPEPREVHGSIVVVNGTDFIDIKGKIEWDEDAQMFVVKGIEGLPETRDVHGSVGAEAGVSTGKGGKTEGHVGVNGKIEWDEAQPEPRDVHGSVGAEAGVSTGKGGKTEGHVGVNGKIEWDEAQPEPRDVHGSVEVGAGASSGHGGHPEGHIGVNGKIDWDEAKPEPRDVHGSAGAEAGVSTGKGGKTEGHVGVNGKIEWDEAEPEPRDVHGSVGAEAGVSTGKGGKTEGHVGVNGKIEWDQED